MRIGFSIHIKNRPEDSAEYAFGQGERARRVRGEILQSYLFWYNPNVAAPVRSLFWIGSSKKDLMALPVAVRKFFGHALNFAQNGEQHDAAKVIKGFAGAGVLEVVEDDADGTYRAVYTVKFKEAVFVLHCFQKKSKSGIATPKRDMEIVRARLKAAEAHAKELRNAKTHP